MKTYIGMITSRAIMLLGRKALRDPIVLHSWAYEEHQLLVTCLQSDAHNLLPHILHIYGLSFQTPYQVKRAA